MNGIIPSRDAWDAIRDMYRWWSTHKVQGVQNGQQGQSDRRVSRHPLRIVITTEEIAPNTYGTAKFTTGAKGSESVTGDAYQMFYRAEGEDAPNCPGGTKCFAIWIPCDTLEDDETGWELTPVECIGT